MDHFPLLVPLMIALSSGLHCLGMCGGILGAMTFSFPADMGRGRLWLFLLAAHGGRILSYAVAGGVAAIFGQTVLATLSPQYGHTVLQLLAAATLISTGLFLSGWFPGLRWLERIGQPIWRYIEPLARRFIVPRTPWHAFFFGVLWGWLPCSMVYSALLWSSSACSPAWSSVAMAIFGLGTLPATVAAGWLVNRANLLANWTHVRGVVAVLLILLGGASLHWSGAHLHHDPFGGNNGRAGLCTGGVVLE